MTDQHQQILDSSPEAATYRTDIRGWVSRRGLFCGDGPHSEACAREDGATHTICKTCGTIRPVRSSCRVCAERQRAEAYAALPVVEWDGEAPVVEFDGDHYVFDGIDGVVTLCDGYPGESRDPATLRLVLCTKEFASERSATDDYDDLTPEDGELPDWLMEAYDALNATIREHREAGDECCWFGGKVAVRLTEEQLAEVRRELGIDDALAARRKEQKP